MTGNFYRMTKICETIIALIEAEKLMESNLTSKDDKISTYIKPYDMIDLAIDEQVKLLAFESGIKVEEP